MAIINSGAGIIFVDASPNSAPAIVPNQGEDAELAWMPSTSTLYYFDRTFTIWKVVVDSAQFTVTDGTTPQTIDNGDTITLTAGNTVSFDTSAPDDITAEVILDPIAGNIITSTAAGLAADIVIGDGFSGEGTVASPLELSIDTSTPNNALVETAGQGLYVANEIITSAVPLGGIAPAGAQWGINTTAKVMYFVNAAGNWELVPSTYVLTVTDGTNVETLSDGDAFTVAASDNVDLVVSAVDTLTATVIVDPVISNIITSSATGLKSTINVGDGLAGTGTLASPLEINIDTSTANNALTETPGQGLYVAHEIIENAGALAGAAPVGAKWGVNTATGVFYYVAGGNWVPVPVTYSFSVTDGTTTETIINADSLTFEDTTSINFVVAAGDKVTAAAKLSTTLGNDLSIDATGLFLDVAAGETPILFTTDTTATGVTLLGINEHTIDITLLSTDANNTLVTGTDGGLLYTVYPAANNDVAAGIAGVPLGKTYTLTGVNTYGLPEGLHKTRIN